MRVLTRSAYRTTLHQYPSILYRTDSFSLHNTATLNLKISHFHVDQTYHLSHRLTHIYAATMKLSYNHSTNHLID